MNWSAISSYFGQSNHGEKRLDRWSDGRTNKQRESKLTCRVTTKRRAAFTTNKRAIRQNWVTDRRTVRQTGIQSNGQTETEAELRCCFVLYQTEKNYIEKRPDRRLVSRNNNKVKRVSNKQTSKKTIQSHGQTGRRNNRQIDKTQETENELRRCFAWCQTDKSQRKTSRRTSRRTPCVA